MRPLIAANWKMNKTIEEAADSALRLKVILKDVKGVDVAIFPPFTAIYEVGKILKSTDILLGAQDVFWEEKGAFTGEVSPEMVKDLGCSFVIIGHSERRKYFNETDEAINKKIRKCVVDEINIILCVGETLERRDAGKQENVVGEQLRKDLDKVQREDLRLITIAYEPVWAIGTGKTATPAQAEEMHSFIRDILGKMYGKKSAESVRILYGGSVTPENISGLMEQNDINGALVGGASLDPESFAKIVKGF